MKLEQPRHRVLIVDDMPANIRILIEALRSDYDVMIAKDGEKALEIAKEKSPDLILLDVVMPKMDGYTVCRELKASDETRHIPVIFITSKSEEEDEAKGFGFGAVDYISKPFSLPIVRARVSTHLELKRHRDFLEWMLKERSEELEKTQQEYLRLFMK